MASAEVTKEVPAVPTPVEEPDEVQQDGEYEVVAGPEVTSGAWNLPNVEVSKVEVQTGEEHEEVFWTSRSRLYRWATSSSEWKQRGTGQAKLLQHKESKRIRFVMRQEKTEKVIANFFVKAVEDHEEYCKLQPNAGNDKIWNWTCVNQNEEGDGVAEQLALRFGLAEDAKTFETKWYEARKVNTDIGQTKE